MDNQQVTISTGITRFKKDHIIKAMIHNHRMESSHRNIVNENTNYYYNLENEEQLKINPGGDKNERRKDLRRTTRAKYKKHLDTQMKLMTKRNKEKGFATPKEKDLNPIAEGVVNFGDVYNVGVDTKEVRLKKSNDFHNRYSEEEWAEIFELIKDNLLKFSKVTNTQLLDLTFHRDEEGLYHFHYLITNYNNQTGEHLNVRQNKNGIGDRLQDIIAEGFEEFNIKRAIGKRRGKKKLSKEELVSMETMREEIGQLEEQLKESNTKVREAEEKALEIVSEGKEEVRLLINNAMSVSEEAIRLMDIMQHIINELSDMDPRDTYRTKEKLNKILKSTKYAIGKDKFDIAHERMTKFEECVLAFDKKGGGDGSLTKSLEDIKTNNQTLKPN